MAKQTNEEIIVINEAKEPYTACSETVQDSTFLIRNKGSGNLRRSQRNRGSFRRRLVHKSGTEDVHPAGRLRSLLRLIYVHDLANTLINCSWRWTLLVVVFTFYLSWFIFAGSWMLIARNNGDLEENMETPCLTGIESFAGYLLFSVETQMTIGYGNRHINHHCPEAVIVLCIQMAVGICICGILASIVYEKISGPAKINSMNSFSRNALICQRDGELCLMFRVKDCDRRYQCHNEIKAYLVQKKGKELFLKSIKLESIGILIWPIEIVHKINVTSPFWDLSARDLITKRFEIIVVMEGTSLLTGNMSTTTTSYLSKEMLWGHVFKQCVFYDKDENQYVVNHKLFNKTREIVMPLCSAKKLQEVFDRIPFLNGTNSNLTNSPNLSDLTEGKGNSTNTTTTTSITLSPVTVHASSLDESGNSCNGRRSKCESDEEIQIKYVGTSARRNVKDRNAVESYIETDF